MVLCQLVDSRRVGETSPVVAAHAKGWMGSSTDYSVSRSRDLGGSPHQPLPSRFSLADISAANVVAMSRREGIVRKIYVP